MKSELIIIHANIFFLQRHYYKMRKSSSYLSSNVRQLLRLSVEPCRDSNLNNQALQCLRQEGQVLVFEDQPIQFLLGSVITDDYSQRTKEWYKVVLRR